MTASADAAPVDAAVTAGAFAAAMEGLPVQDGIAAAVSGGGDSMALCLLLAEWAGARGLRFKAYTVNHGLRAEAGAEAENVAAVLKQRGIAHDILRWQGDKPATHLQEKARAARYRLLAAACARDGFSHLAVAHNAEDQMETFWMRLAHGSGLDGLAAMPRARALTGAVMLLRPLLPFSRAALRATCRDRGVAWVEDPSNENARFLRVRLRAFEQLLGEEGLTPHRLAQVVQKLADARAALACMVDEKYSLCAAAHPAGYVTLAHDAWRGLPDELRRRVLARAIAAVAPQEYPVPAAALARVAAEMAASGFRGCSIAGAVVSGIDGGTVTVCREYAALPPAQPLADGMYRDARWRITAPDADESLTVSALGENGVAMLRKALAAAPEKRAVFDNLAGRARAVLPALWQGENLVAVPYLSWFSNDAPPAARGVTAVFCGHAAAGKDCLMPFEGYIIEE